MSLPVLRDDALTTSGGYVALRVSLPWIRSLPLASLTDVALSIDGAQVRTPRVRLGDRTVATEHLAAETGWWFVQDRVVLVGDRAPAATPHEVALSFRLVIPYLSAGPDTPLVLPFHTRRALAPDVIPEPTVSREVA
ncbi:hypothetical protein [Salinactinospora qingdaonensis]|uniref:Uncharacterized protein n=1 Tax=Salinactinospora qingdaonensis TaxID=702744 RepID=A0ABP7G7E6_9ACTN